MICAPEDIKEVMQTGSPGILMGKSAAY